MSLHPKKERTLVLIKPDGLQRTLVGEILKRYERVGLKLVGLKIIVPTPEFVEQHYSLDPEWRRVTGEKRIQAAKERGEEPPSYDPIEVTEIVLRKLKKYMSSGPVVAMVWEGAHVVEIVRKITGGTEPRSSDVGTIRGDYVLDSYTMADIDDRSVRNLVHASGSNEEAVKEINHWFKPSELIDYKLIQEKILYDVNLDGILE
jgi:nucleoside-diphosphate kinase